MFAIDHHDGGTPAPAGCALGTVDRDIDGRPVTVSEGIGLMRAAAQARVPTPKLGAIGTLEAFGSRLCLVLTADEGVQVKQKDEWHQRVEDARERGRPLCSPAAL
jgi:hypothetical protein